MNDIILPLMTGIDIPIPECCLILHQPTIKEISYIGEKAYFTGAQCLCLTSSMYEDGGTNFSVFMKLMREEKAKDKRRDVESVLTLLFPNYNIIFTPRSILFNQNEESFIIDEGNLEDLQKILEQVFCLNKNGQQSFNPGNKAAKAIADKLMRARQRVAEEKHEGIGSLLAQYSSILTIGLESMSLQNVIELTVFQLYDLVERFQLYMAWDIDARSRLAGGKPDSKPEDWMKVIH